MHLFLDFFLDFFFKVRINFCNVSISCGILSKCCRNAEGKDHPVFRAVFGGFAANKANMSDSEDKVILGEHGLSCTTSEMGYILGSGEGK